MAWGYETVCQHIEPFPLTAIAKSMLDKATKWIFLVSLPGSPLRTVQQFIASVLF